MSAPALPDRPTPVPQDLFSETYGGSLICCMFSLPLYGISLLQMYIYFSNYPGDTKWLKLMVLALGVVESVHTWMTCHTVYHYSILSYSRPETLIQGEWSVYAAEAIGTLICFLVEVYFVHMVYRITNGKVYRKPLLAIFIFLVTAQFGFGLYVSISAFLLWELTKLFTLVYPGLVPMYVIRVVVDGLAAAVLCTVLHDSKAEFRGSVKLVRTLIIYAMNRFLLTTLVVIMQTIVLLVRPQSIWAMVIDFVTVHLYVNSLLATLNARNRLRMIQSHPPTYIQSGSGKYQTGGTRHEIDTQDSTRFQPPHEGRETRAVQSKSKTSVNVVLDEGSGYESDGIKVRTETFVMTDLEPNRKNAPSGNLV